MRMIPPRITLLVCALGAILAGAGSAVAGLAGAALAMVVLPSLSATWESTWGRLLLVKLALVGVVAAIGAHNHLRLIPRLVAEPGGGHGHRADPADPPVEIVAWEEGAVPKDAGAVATLTRVGRPVRAPAVRDESVAAALRRNAAVEVLLLGASSR